MFAAGKREKVRHDGSVVSDFCIVIQIISAKSCSNIAFIFTLHKLHIYI